jgi:uncharacterized phage protein (TIGR02220 family)
MITNGMPWFRMYHEMIDDPKVGTLDDGQFRLWVEMLCLACECGNSGDTDLTEPEINWKLRRNVTENILVLIDRGLVEEKKHKSGRVTFKIKNWEKRQFASDCSTVRVQKYRQKKKRNVSETFQKRPCNVIDTDTDITKVSGKMPYKKIIDYLNSKAGTNYRPSTKATQRFIRARFNEGFTLDDFYTVISHKSREWKTDPKMVQYLRPETLFGTKFESYLQKIKPEETKKVFVA